MWSLESTLAPVLPVTPEALLPEAARSRVLAVARRLPAALTRCFYFERWLTAPAARVDLIVRVDADGRGALAERRSPPFGAELLAQPVWERLSAFARAWSDPGGALEGAVESLWLEFDLPEGGVADVVTVPRVFVDFTREVREGATVSEQVSLLGAALRILTTGEAEGPILEHARACLARLPPGSSVPYFGLCPGSREPGLRVCVQGLGEGLLPYLRAVGWPGSADGLEREVLAPLRAAGAAASVVHMEMAPAAAPRLGLEYPFARAPQERGRVQEAALLDTLAERGWCGREQHEALLRWPGQAVELLPHEIWLSRLSRRINHVKVTYAAAEPVAVKAYLRVQHGLAAEGTLLGERPWRPAAGRPPSPTARRAPALSDSAPAPSRARRARDRRP